MGCCCGWEDTSPRARIRMRPSALGFNSCCVTWRCWFGFCCAPVRSTRLSGTSGAGAGCASRGCYETPGGTLLIAAHRELEALCLEREVAHFKQNVALKYAELVYFGLWFTPLREALDAFVASTQTEMTGSVTLSLYKGNVSVVSRQSEHSLYRTDLSSFTMGDSYDQKDAAGFIRILGLPSRTRARARVEVAR